MPGALPNSRGFRRGEDARINQDESQSVRQKQRTAASGWIISTVGETLFGHQDVTGVVTIANRLNFFMLPERLQDVEIYSCRIKVSVAAASSTCTVALFQYLTTPSIRLEKIPGSEITFATSSTGLQDKVLAQITKISASARLFLGVVCTDATVAIEGFQSGTATSPRLCRIRYKAGVTPPFDGSYQIGSLTLDDTEDAPMVVYLSRDAANVL